MVKISDEEHADKEDICVECQGLSPVDSEFFQIKEFFQSGEEPFDADPFCIFVFEPSWISRFDSGF